MTPADDTTIDVGSWFRTLVRNWWVILALVVLGAVVGGVVTMLTPKEYSATSSVYIGQTTDALGQAMAGLNSNPKAATQLLASQALLDQAAQATGMGMKPGRLRRETTVETPSQTIKTTVSAVNIVVITVTDTKKVRATAAANALADALVAKLSPSVEAKVTLLEQQLADGQKAEAAATARSNVSQAAITAIAKGGGTAAEKAAIAAALADAKVQADAIARGTGLTITGVLSVSASVSPYGPVPLGIVAPALGMDTTGSTPAQPPVVAQESLTAFLRALQDLTGDPKWAQPAPAAIESIPLDQIPAHMAATAAKRPSTPA
ncbi:MAG: Wzz/FepE/Etk N-terminal domain-containing protein [Actinomycetes bacterium]